MAESLFVVEQEHYRPTAHSLGPWSDQALHGGPVAALLAHELNGLETPGRMLPARFTLELLRPVGLEALAVETTIVRPGRKVRVLEARLHRQPDAPRTAETLVARATLQQIRLEAMDLPVGAVDQAVDPSAPPPPDEVPAATGMIDGAVGPRFHTTAVEHRSPREFFGVPGPAVDWIRVVVDLVPGVPLTPYERVVAAADFGNGISGVLPFGEYAFVNPDLSVFVRRPPVGDWVCLDATTRLGPEGTGLAECVLYDEAGRLGSSAQTLIIERMG